MRVIQAEVPICVATLPPTERFFLWAIRAWSAHHSDLTPIWRSLDHAFTQEHITAALEPFDQFMSALFAGLRRWPDIRCVACPRLGTDERQLLSAFAHLQQGNGAVARCALQTCVLDSAARMVVRHARRCAEQASAAGLQFASVSFVLAKPLDFPPCPRAATVARVEVVKKEEGG